MTGTQVVWDFHITTILMSCYTVIVVHTNTAPTWVKVGNTERGMSFRCAKLRCVDLTAKWEDRGGFKRANHENIMSHDLRTKLRTVKNNLGFPGQTRFRL